MLRCVHEVCRAEYSGTSLETFLLYCLGILPGHEQSGRSTKPFCHSAEGLQNIAVVLLKESSSLGHASAVGMALKIGYVCACCPSSHLNRREQSSEIIMLLQESIGQHCCTANLCVTLT